MTWKPSDSALRCRIRFTAPTEGVDEAVDEVDVFRLCFDDRSECAEYAEPDEAFEDARDRVRSSVDVAGEESAEK